MAQTLAQKLKLKEIGSIFLAGAPAAYAGMLAQPHSSIRFVEQAEAADQIHWFVKNAAELNQGLPGIVARLKPEHLLWVFYPKGSSGIQTDLTRDTGWETMQTDGRLQHLTLISFDDTWSAFGMRLKNESDKKKEVNPEPREIYKYADSATKTIRLPEDLAKALSENPDSAAAFEALAFSHRREYVEWIVTAKKAETRAERINGTVERVLKGWKNPRNL